MHFSFLSQAELRASVFEAIEEEDRVIEKDQGLPPALLGSCNDRAKQLHASPPGFFLPAFFSIPNPTFLLLFMHCNLLRFLRRVVTLHDLNV